MIDFPHTSWLLHHLIEDSARRTPAAPALTVGGQTLDYATLWQAVADFGASLAALGLSSGERVGIYLDKRTEAVVASFGSSVAGTAFVPINPLLKAEQVAYILRDCNVRILVTSPERLNLLTSIFPTCTDLQHIVVTGNQVSAQLSGGPTCHAWSDLPRARPHHTLTELDMAAILYTSGSTGRPKGVVLSHRNLLAGAKSVAEYLGNNPDDSILAALPLSFDAGFSQLTTTFHAGARVVLLNYLMPRDIVKALECERITGMTAVPPLWLQLASLSIPEAVGKTLRYIANTGGHLPTPTLHKLLQGLPQARPYLMYGLTEAFRATYLPPEEAMAHPDSIGRAIPNNEVWVLREDGTVCDTNEPGELVQRGPLVAMGYWNDAEKTAERFRPLPAALRPAGLMLPEIAVYSGDTVRRDENGLLYFMGRRDEMIKTSGYRVSPSEVEEEAYATGIIRECAAFGVPHPVLGAAIVLAVVPTATLEVDVLLAALKKRCPSWQVPAHIELCNSPLPRNANGKIDRKRLTEEFSGLFASEGAGK
jgi:acyl-CoA ligase (AMP-forming) (exosortase A-associated)